MTKTEIIEKVNNLKKQLLDIINKKELFSFELICEEIEYKKRIIGIEKNSKSFLSTVE